MNRKGKVYSNGKPAGIIGETSEGYSFTYDKSYLDAPATAAICLAMPKQNDAYTSPHLFPFFHGLLTEGVTKELQCRKLRIDENDYFGRLLKTTHDDPIGSITVEEIEPS